jgi:limonene-1,2-epoxide hydrolase
MIKLSKEIWVSLLNGKRQQHRKASGAIRDRGHGQRAGIDVAAVMGEASSAAVWRSTLDCCLTNSYDILRSAARDFLSTTKGCSSLRDWFSCFDGIVASIMLIGIAKD